MPYKIKGGGKSETVRPIVLKVHTHDSLGRPRMLEAVYDEETVDLTNPFNREFLIVFAPPKAWAADPKKAEGHA